MASASMVATGTSSSTIRMCTAAPRCNGLASTTGTCAATVIRSVTGPGPGLARDRPGQNCHPTDRMCHGTVAEAGSGAPLASPVGPRDGPERLRAGPRSEPHDQKGHQHLPWIQRAVVAGEDDGLWAWGERVHELAVGPGEQDEVADAAPGRGRHWPWPEEPAGEGLVGIE